jgi:multidrug efflux system membrane fusion protein
MKARRLLIPVLLAALLAACGSHEAPAPAPRPVVFEHPTADGAAGSEVYPGAVRARVETDLAFRVAGKIAERKVVAGSLVKAGDVLAVLDPQDSQLNLAAAQADNELAQSEYKRYVDLYKKGFVSHSLVDQYSNQAKLAQAKFNLIKNQSSYTELKADNDGVISSVLAEAGQVVAAGQPVMRFAAHGGREVMINVPEGRYEALRATPMLRISLWALPGKVYSGSLREISPQADAATRTHEARITIEDAGEEVQLGMTASVYAGEAAGEPRYRLPLTAIAGTKEQPAVWVIDGDHVRGVPVRVANYLEDAAIVQGALKTEDRVVTAGAHLLTDGENVTAVARNRHGAGA